MPAVVDDPDGPTVYRVSGQPPFPDPGNPVVPSDIIPRQVTLRDRQTVATIVPLAAQHLVPRSLCAYLCDQINKEIESGDTYPMMETFDADSFARYWFQSFGAVMLLGSLSSADDVAAAAEGRDWAKECLGSFCIKPNYPGRSSHVCNASFLVTDASRNRGVGRLMGEAYIDWAPRLGFTYSVFNLVYETNVASCKLWDGLGFKRIGRIKGCGNLRSHPDRLIDAIIYGRDLAPGESEELVSEERFDKIKFYLKYAKYPSGADRAEKSRLRSAATHYKLLDGDKLMLKDKEVISDPGRQYEIARGVHVVHHAGINKTTATIAEKYHWSRIKETVSDVIRTCAECKELGKTPNLGATGGNGAGTRRAAAATANASLGSHSLSSSDTGGAGRQPGSGAGAAGRVLALQEHGGLMSELAQGADSPSPGVYANMSDMSVVAPSFTLQNSQQGHGLHDAQHHHQHHQHQHQHQHQLEHQQHQRNQHQLVQHGQHDQHHHEQHHTHHSHHNHHNPMLQEQSTNPQSPVYQPIDPQIINHHDATAHDDDPFDHYHPHSDFQALLGATEDVDVDVGIDVGVEGAQRSDEVDRDLEMLIEHHDDDDDNDMGDLGEEQKGNHGQRGLYDGFGDG